MPTKSNVFMLFLCSASVGCSNGLSSVSTPHQEGFIEQNQKIIYGVPFIQTTEASTVRLDEEWELTAKHNKHLLDKLGLDVIYHPECDVALIKRPRHQDIKTRCCVYRGTCYSRWLPDDARADLQRGPLHR